MSSPYIFRGGIRFVVMGGDDVPVAAVFAGQAALISLADSAAEIIQRRNPASGVRHVKQR